MYVCFSAHERACNIGLAVWLLVAWTACNPMCVFFLLVIYFTLVFKSKVCTACRLLALFFLMLELRGSCFTHISLIIITSAFFIFFFYAFSLVVLEFSKGIDPFHFNLRTYAMDWRMQFAWSRGECASWVAALYFPGSGTSTVVATNNSSTE